MFKIIKEGTPQGLPVLQIICDGSCGNIIAAEVQPGAEEELPVHNVFVQSAAQQGWLVRFDQQLCPEHAKRHVESIQFTKKRIQVVGSLALKN